MEFPHNLVVEFENEVDYKTFCTKYRKGYYGFTTQIHDGLSYTSNWKFIGARDREVVRLMDQSSLWAIQNQYPDFVLTPFKVFDRTFDRTTFIIRVSQEEYTLLIKSKELPVSLTSLTWTHDLWNCLNYQISSKTWQLDKSDNPLDKKRVNLQEYCKITGIDYYKVLGVSGPRQQFDWTIRDKSVAAASQNFKQINILNYVCILNTEYQWKELQSFMSGIYSINGIKIAHNSCSFQYLLDNSWKCFAPVGSASLSFWIYNSKTTEGKVVVEIPEYYELLKRCTIIHSCDRVEPIKNLVPQSDHDFDVDPFSEIIKEQGLPDLAQNHTLTSNGPLSSAEQQADVKFVVSDDDDEPTVFNSPNPKLSNPRISFDPIND